MFLIGSPMCTVFSSLQAMNAPRRDPAVVHREYVQAMVHLRFVCELYEQQMAEGRYFLHEHPANATSWQEPCIQSVAQTDGVETTVMDQCQYGQATEAGEPIMKPTKWMTNAPCLASSLGKRCKGRGGACSREKGGRHQVVQGRAMCKKSQQYSFELCKSILMGCRRQLIEDGRLVLGVIGIQRPEENLSERQLLNIVIRYADEDPEVPLAVTDLHHKFTDSITGQPLNTDLVHAARKKELEYFAAKRVWRKVPRADAMRLQGKPPITVKWIDVNKGDDENHNYRSRLVAREVRKPWEASVFAPTPPLEALRSILSIAATEIRGIIQHDRSPTSELRTQVSVVDISRAYFNAKIDESQPSFVELPPEDPDKERGMCGRLVFHMYGTRPAGKGWHTEYSEFLVEQLGFTIGDASACVFRNVEKGVMTSCYGDTSRPQAAR